MEECIEDELSRAKRYLEKKTETKVLDVSWEGKRNELFWPVSDAANHILLISYCLNSHFRKLSKWTIMWFQVLDDVLINQHMQTIVDMENSGVVHMLANDKVDWILESILKRIKEDDYVLWTVGSRYCILFATFLS